MGMADHVSVRVFLTGASTDGVLCLWNGASTMEPAYAPMRDANMDYLNSYLSSTPVFSSTSGLCFLPFLDTISRVVFSILPSVAICSESSYLAFPLILLWSAPTNHASLREGMPERLGKGVREVHGAFCLVG